MPLRGAEHVTEAPTERLDLGAIAASKNGAKRGAGNGPGSPTGRPGRPPPPRRTRAPLYALIAAIVVIVVQGVVGTVVALADTPGPGSNPRAVENEKDAKGAKDTKGGAQASKGPAPGVPVADGDVEFVLRSVRCGLPAVPEDTAEYQADGRYCLVMVTARNRGETATTLDLGLQRAYEADGTEHTPNAEVSEAASAPAFLGDIAPGSSVTGTLVFDVDTGAKINAVKLRGADATKGVRIPF
jgi:hypothetical protein